MKYLYGDSVPCPIQYNFLAAFETFIDAAAQTVKLDQEIARVQEKTESAAKARERALEVVEEFHRKNMDALKKLSDTYGDPNTAVYARQVREHAESVVEEARNNCRLAREKDEKERGAEFDRRRKDVASALERFLKTELVAVVGSTLTMSLIEGRNQLTAVLSHPGEIMTTFTMSAGATIWQSPVVVSSLVQGLDLQVGVRKSWITGSKAKSAVNLDDFVIGGFELGDDTAEIRLRRRADQPDVFIFRFERKGDKLTVELERKDDESDDGSLLDDADRTKLEQLWQMLRKAASGALRQRGRLLGVRIDGQDLLEQRRLRPFIERVVKGIAPAVKDIAKHSPNPAELSMKVEDDDGRREEIYVRRESLVASLQILDNEGKIVFAPLGLLPETLTSDDVDVDV